MKTLFIWYFIICLLAQSFISGLYFFLFGIVCVICGFIGLVGKGEGQDGL